ncbi:hypothetical protein ACFVDQ_16295 [Streptomyces sp. NPDC057684]
MTDVVMYEVAAREGGGSGGGARGKLRALVVAAQLVPGDLGV